MPNSRLGCKQCFKTLDPQDKTEANRIFVKCSKCGEVYHADCWHQLEKCLCCGNHQTNPVTASFFPPSPKVLTKTKSIPIKSSTVIHVEDGGALEPSILYFVQVGRAIVLAIFLITIATFIGAFTYRLTQLQPIELETVMDVIFKQSPPPLLTFVSAFISGTIIASIFYTPSRLNDSNTNERTGRFTHFLAGLIMIASLDILLFNVTAPDLVKLNINLRAYEEVLYAQGATTLLIILLIPLHKGLAPVTISPPKLNLPSYIIILYGWMRFLFVSLLLNLFFVYLSTRGLPSRLNVPKLANISLELIEFALTLPMAGAFVAGLAIASILYWPPKSRGLTSHFGILRLLLVILCIISIGFMYRMSTNSQGYIYAVIIAGVAMVVAAPVQRSLS
jgi:hypothetical protein